MRRRNGTSLVEGAMVTGLFLCLTTGVVDVAQLLFVDHSLTERVRVGARYAALHGGEAAAAVNVVLYQAATPPVGARPLFGLDAAMVSVARLDANTPADRIQVTIRDYRPRTVSPFLLGRIAARSYTSTAPLESQGAAN